MKRALLFVITFAIFLVGSLVWAYQGTPVKNPALLAFTCPDHATDVAHEVAIVRESDGAIVQTIAAGDPPLVNGEVFVSMNVMPVAFGRYRFKARAGGLDASGATVWSDWSDPTEVWERAPGKVTDLRAIAK